MGIFIVNMRRILTIFIPFWIAFFKGFRMTYKIHGNSIKMDDLNGIKRNSFPSTFSKYTCLLFILILRQSHSTVLRIHELYLDAMMFGFLWCLLRKQLSFNGLQTIDVYIHRFYKKKITKRSFDHIVEVRYFEVLYDNW